MVLLVYSFRLIQGFHHLQNPKGSTILKFSSSYSSLVKSNVHNFPQQLSTPTAHQHFSTGKNFRIKSTTVPSSHTTDINISTYNVLSSHLGAPNYYQNCRPEYLNSKYRLQVLKEKLNQQISKNTIICLQEVSMTWTNELHTFFSQNKYYFISTHYGNKFNNYMGCGIAVPLEHYEIVASHIKRVADTITLKQTTNPNTEKFEKLSKFSRLLSIMKEIFTFENNESISRYQKIDPWTNSCDRKNHIIVLTLRKRSSGQEFVVGTYHMPCVFLVPSIMMIHSVLSTRYVQNIASNGKLPYIFCGDFNITPTSSMYKLLTQGTLPPDNPDIPPVIPALPADWSIKVDPMSSAYLTINGKEPDFTNCAQVKEDPVFIDTLDYIFLSKENWNVKSVESLPSFSFAKENGPMPLRNEPSDHLLLAATLELKNSL